MLSYFNFTFQLVSVDIDIQLDHVDIGINVGYAIVYEAARTITTIYPDSGLLEETAKSIARFITSDSHNLKYLGGC